MKFHTTKVLATYSASEFWSRLMIKRCHGLLGKAVPCRDRN